MPKWRMQSTIACGLLMFYLMMTLTAGGASPLATQRAKIGPYQLLLSYYSLPRAGQALSMTIESSTPGVTVQFSQAALNPAPGTDAKTVSVTLTPNSDSEGVQVTGVSGSVVGVIPINVDGPPEIPTWLGWLIGLTPLPLLLGFIWLQVKWRKTQRKHLSPNASTEEKAPQHP